MVRIVPYPLHLNCVLLAYQVPQEAVVTVPETATNPAEPTRSTLEKAKDYIGVGWSLAQMLLKKIPDVVDTNPVKIAFGLAKIILELKEVRRQFFSRVCC
jgi:hypothetical protein